MKGLVDLLGPTKGLSAADTFRVLDGLISVDVAIAPPTTGQTTPRILSYREVAEAKVAALRELVELPAGARLSDRSVDALLVHRTGVRHYFDLHSMKLAQTRRCLVSGLFLPELPTDDSILVCSFSPHWAVTSDCGYFFPGEARLSVFYGLQQNIIKKTLIGKLIIAKILLIDEDIPFQLDRTRDSVLFVEHFAPHFGHYYWNVLSGWDELIGCAGPDLVRGVAWTDQPFGPRASDIWPDRVACLAEPFAEPSAAFERYAAQASLLPVTLGSDRISCDLAQRVLAVAERGASAETRSWLARQAAMKRKLVALSLRLGNRKWENQAEGFLSLAREISDRFPSPAFIVDGMSADTPKTQSHALMPFDEEVALASHLQRAIGAFAPCLSVVGGSVNDALHAVASCDYFFAPAGSGLAKFLWLANKPGLVFSNPEVLRGETAQARAVRVFETFREGGTVARWLPSDRSVSLGNRSKRGNAAEDFDLDWRDLLTEAAPELEPILASTRIPAP